MTQRSAALWFLVEYKKKLYYARVKRNHRNWVLFESCANTTVCDTEQNAESIPGPLGSQAGPLPGGWEPLF